MSAKLETGGPSPPPPAFKSEAEPLMRKWHRWAAIPAGLFLFFVSLTGVLLHVDMIRVGKNPPGHEPSGAEAIHPIPSNAELSIMIARIANAARAEKSMPIKSIQIELGGPKVMLVAGPGGPPGSPQIRLDGQTGERIAMDPPPANFHFILQDVHAGYFFGWTGRILSLLIGLALLALSVTGLQMWWDMRRRGKKGIYWK